MRVDRSAAMLSVKAEAVWLLAARPVTYHGAVLVADAWAHLKQGWVDERIQAR